MNNQTMKTLMSSKKMDWETPLYLFDFFNKIYNYEVDIWSSNKNALCQKFYDETNNAVGLDWSENNTVKCGFGNPPYGRFLYTAIKEHYRNWIENDFHSSILMPARTDTKYFHEFCKNASKIYFFKGRINFCVDGKPILDPKTNKPMPAPFPSMLVHFGEKTNKEVEFSFIDIKQIKNIYGIR